MVITTVKTVMDIGSMGNSGIPLLVFVVLDEPVLLLLVVAVTDEVAMLPAVVVLDDVAATLSESVPELALLGKSAP